MVVSCIIVSLSLFFVALDVAVYWALIASLALLDLLSLLALRRINVS